jgi:DNA invertase Pin-like site-specific DNA recombinase
MASAKIYTRLSRDEVGQTSTADQERECRALAMRLGISAIEMYCEEPGTSGFKDVARPVFDRLMTELSDSDVVLAWALDRLTRRGMEQAGQILRVLEERGARLVTVSDGIDTALDIGSDLAVGIRAIMAREYSKGISRNVKRGKATGAAAGKFAGGQRWYGYAGNPDGTWNGPAEIDEAEAKILHEIRDRYVAGERFLSIAVDLNQRGIPTVQGTEWRAENMLRLLTRKRYAGIREHHGVDYPAAWPAIFTAEEYAELIAARHQEHRMKTWPTGPSGYRRYLLTGFVYCHRGNKMVGCRATGHTNAIRRYKCRGIENTGRVVGCNSLYRSAEPIEIMVEQAVVYILDTSELAKMLNPGTDSAESSNDSGDFRSVERVGALP